MRVILKRNGCEVTMTCSGTIDRPDNFDFKQSEIKTNILFNQTLPDTLTDVIWFGLGFSFSRKNYNTIFLAKEIMKHVAGAARKYNKRVYDYEN